MHVTPWIAASGFLLAAYAGPGRPVGHDDTLYVNDLVESPQPRRVDVTTIDHGQDVVGALDAP